MYAETEHDILLGYVVGVHGGFRLELLKRYRDRFRRMPNVVGYWDEESRLENVEIPAGAYYTLEGVAHYNSRDGVLWNIKNLRMASEKEIEEYEHHRKWNKKTYDWICDTY